jgi:hypothetical protein
MVPGMGPNLCTREAQDVGEFIAMFQEVFAKKSGNCG